VGFARAYLTGVESFHGTAYTLAVGVIGILPGFFSGFYLHPSGRRSFRFQATGSARLQSAKNEQWLYFRRLALYLNPF
jgi:hypothetical protein